MDTPELFDCVDAFMFYEGETAFSALVEEWQKGNSGLDAPNAMVLQDGRPVQSAKTHIEDLNRLPSPVPRLAAAA